MPSVIQQRLLDLGCEIAAAPADDLGFIHSIMAQCALPTARPPEGTLVWERQQGRARLLLEAGKCWTPRPAPTAS